MWALVLILRAPIVLGPRGSILDTHSRVLAPLTGVLDTPAGVLSTLADMLSALAGVLDTLAGVLGTHLGVEGDVGLGLDLARPDRQLAPVHLQTRHLQLE